MVSSYSTIVVTLTINVLEDKENKDLMKSTKHHFSLVFEAYFPLWTALALLLSMSFTWDTGQSKLCVFITGTGTHRTAKSPHIINPQTKQNYTPMVVSSLLIFGDMKKNGILLTKLNGQN